MNANGDLTVDFRSNIGAESRAKVVYERLLQFTDDPYIYDSLRFLMTRDIAHFQQFSAALCDHRTEFPSWTYARRSPRRSHLLHHAAE